VPGRGTERELNGTWEGAGEGGVRAFVA